MAAEKVWDLVLDMDLGLDVEIMMVTDLDRDLAEVWETEMVKMMVLDMVKNTNMNKKNTTLDV